MPVNIKNPAIKRIHADVRELLRDPSDQYHAAPLETNLFEWHFTLRGPPDTEFEGGVYHGRILLPPEYPFRPPDIIFTTPNGRFKVGTKICLSISSYHPEHWQPAWGTRLILEALISFFPTPSHGALGGLDWTPEERKRLAAESREWKCYKCGLARDLLPELRQGASSKANSYANQIKELHKLKTKTAKEIGAEESISGAPTGASPESAGGGVERGVSEQTSSEIAERTESSAVNTEVNGRSVTEPERHQGDADVDADASFSSRADRGIVRGAETGRQAESQGGDDVMLSFLAVAIVVAIVAVLSRKALRYFDVY